MKITILDDPGFTLNNVTEVRHATTLEYVTEDSDYVVIKTALIDKLLPQKTEQYIKSSTHQGIQLIPLSKVICCIAEDKYVIVKHDDGESLISDPLNNIENNYPDVFIRVHRKTIVVKDKIISIEKQEDNKLLVVMKSGHKLFVSRRREPQLRKYIKSKVV